MPCKHARDSTMTYSLCVLNLYGGRPSHGTCARCDKCTEPGWHRQKVQEMLIRQPQAAILRAAVTQAAIQPVPCPEWPLWAKGVALLAVEADAGIGDTAERLAKAAGAKSLVEWAKNKGLPDCGCADRKKRWNQQYPFQKLES